MKMHHHRTPVDARLLFAVVALCFVVVCCCSSSFSDAAAGEKETVYVSRIPEDRTVCNALGNRLLDNEQRAEEARLLPATMRIRKGIVRQSPASRYIAPVFVAFQVVNRSGSQVVNGTDLDSRGAHAAAASLVSSFGLGPFPADHWRRVMRPNGPAGPSTAVDTNAFVHGLLESGVGVISEEEDGSLPNLMGHLSLGRFPVVLMQGCRSSASVPWPLVWGGPSEQYAVVVGVDLDFVYVVMSNFASDAIAMPRAEFLMRWHHLRYGAAVLHGRTYPAQRWVAGVFRLAPEVVAASRNETLDPDTMFDGVMRLLDRPPRVVEFDSICP